MRFYKNNAYPDIVLHDYAFKPFFDGENLIFDFDKGFCVKVEEEYEHYVKGMIKIPQFSLDELNVYSVKYFNFLGIHRKIERYIEVDEFFELCKKLIWLFLKNIMQWGSLYGNVLFIHMIKRCMKNMVI